MQNDDLFNLTLVNSKGSVDQANKAFYGRFNFPWPPVSFPVYPETLAWRFLQQDMGYWHHDRLPARPRIWVAGCGTNQALFTALKYPEAEVLGTDISAQSIQIGKKNAAQMGIQNLQLEERSLNDINYKDAFDYIVCTGVVHHNADPEYTLKKIAAALKPDGVMELMVYNYYHRLMTTACQHAVRSFYDSGTGVDMERELSIVRDLIGDRGGGQLMTQFLKPHADMPEAQVADSLLQPVEYSYTVNSFEKLADNCNLQLLIYCINQYDMANNLPGWNMKFNSAPLTAAYNALPDNKRWYITNLLLFNESPMLWFYLQRSDSSYKRKTEQEICAQFLESRFRKSTFALKNFEINETGTYQFNGTPVTFPALSALRDPLALKLMQVIDPQHTMKEHLHRLGIQPAFSIINNLRNKLTTLAFPYLVAENT